MRQTQPAADRKKTDCTPEIPQVFLLAVAESITPVRGSTARFEPHQKKQLVERIHQTVDRFVHHCCRLGDHGSTELENRQHGIASDRSKHHFL